MPLSVDLVPFILLFGFVCLLAMFLILMRSLAAQRELLREAMNRQNLALAALEGRMMEALQSLRAGAAPSGRSAFVSPPAAQPAAQPAVEDLGALLEGVGKLPPIDAAMPFPAGAGKLPSKNVGKPLLEDKLPSLDAPFGSNGRSSAGRDSLDLKLDS